VAEKSKWLSYEFNVYPFDSDLPWKGIGGIYIFCKIDPQTGQWEPLYVGQTGSFANRIIPSHDQWDAAEELGATHIHAMVAPLAKDRDKIEEELILELDPPLNVQLSPED
jgi:hypothetical protein